MYAHRGNQFAEENFQDGNTYFPAGQRPQHVQRNNLHPLAGHYPMFANPRGNVLPTSVTTKVDVTLEVNSMTFGETSRGGFSGEDFSEVTSTRFDGGDSAFTENLEEKFHDLSPRTISPSAEGKQDDMNQAESDDSSQVCHLKEVAI